MSSQSDEQPEPEYNPDEWPSTGGYVADYNEDGSVTLAIQVGGLGALVMRAARTGETLEFKGVSTFTNAQLGWWDNG